MKSLASLSSNAAIKDHRKSHRRGCAIASKGGREREFLLEERQRLRVLEGVVQGLRRCNMLDRASHHRQAPSTTYVWGDYIKDSRRGE